MKRNFTKILSLLLMLTVLCSLVFAMNITATAASDTIYVNNVAMKNGQYLKENGTAITTEPGSDYAYYKDGVLYLYNFDLKWNGGSKTGGINAGNGDLTIHINGTNTITSSVSQTIVGNYNAKLTFAGEGTLNINSTKDYAIACGNMNVIGGVRLNVNAVGKAIDIASYTQSGGRVNVASTKGYEAFYVEKNVSLTGGLLTITGNGIGIKTTGNVELGRCDITMESVSTGMDCAGNVTINGNGITHITASNNGISCKNFNITKTGEFLVSGQSGLAVSSSNKSWTVDSKYATSVSTNYQGKDAVPLSNQSAATAKYFYTREVDVYIAGIPIAIGDYLPKNGKAASTYKLSDNCVRVQLNGERTELTFSNFDIVTTGSTEGIKATTGIEICGSGILNITSESASAILVSSGYLIMSHSGTVNIKSASHNGIIMGNGSCIQYSGTVNVESKVGLLAEHGDVNIKKGRLNINSSGMGLICKNVKVDGGCLDVVGLMGALTLVGGKISADSSLEVLAAEKSNEPLFNYDSVRSPQRIFIGDHICYGSYATCQTPMTCGNCGRTFHIYVDHVWSKKWDANTKEGHAQKCTTKGCTATTEPQPHTPGAAATETSDQICTDCGYIITPKLEHTHTTTKCADVKATCEKNGNIEYYICSGCSKIFQDAAATKEYTDVNSIVTPPTGHTFAETWSMDAGGHWYACTACGATDGKVNHTPGPEATFTTDQTCSVCGFVIKKAESHTHDFGEHWFSDDSTHWHACACGEVSEKAAHADTDGDSACDSCYWTMEAVADITEPTEQTDATESSSSDNEPTEMPEENDEQGGISPVIIVVCILGVLVLATGTALVIILVKRKKQ